MERIIDRIRKLLRLANDAGASEGERDNAMRMAQATMAKYNLDSVAIGEKIERGDVHFEFRQQHAWTRYVGSACDKLFFSIYYYVRGRDQKLEHHFVGKTANTITAQEMFTYLCESIIKESRKAKAGAAYERSFANAAAAAIYRRADELTKKPSEDFKKLTQTAAAPSGTGTALVALYSSENDANRNFLANVGIRLKQSTGKTRTTNLDGASDGRKYGQSVSLHNQLK